MNIQQAKQQIKNAMLAYFTKNDLGEYEIPIEKQRPVFLLGAPGIGKTAIMEQIAQELGVGLVSYSMTHHTRQSALGLPMIEKKEYDGKPCTVTEYTMSEIIASVYDCMAETGCREGILFLDEINCVSETLAPSMLQFLQYKTFGRHRVPDGWIVVTAGNPPEYNRSVREFDVVTLDRLKRIDVEPDYAAWKQYAQSVGVHPAVLTYLEIRKNHFYTVQSTDEGKRFVTPRGWEDLSQMLRLYERRGLVPDEALVGQYLQQPVIARDFASYYELFVKYQSDYQVEDILAGSAPRAICDRAAAAKFDERLALLGLLLDQLTGEIQTLLTRRDALARALELLRPLRPQLTDAAPELVLQQLLRQERAALEQGRRTGQLSQNQRRLRTLCLQTLEPACLAAQGEPDGAAALARLKQALAGALTGLQADETAQVQRLEHVFAFCQQAFGAGQELLLLVTELTVRPACARFISQCGCPSYFRHAGQLQFHSRQKELTERLEALGL